jgi:pyruvate/2-oxoglutarate dehydrogenase complex dihydrolipoamide acyltransferase (E2) component
MKAKAKNPHGMIRAFTGREFVSYEWRPVPAGADDEAERLEASGYLELKRDAPPKAAPEVVKINATISARAMASSHGLDLTTLEGSGVGGRILISDVERALWDEEE